MADLFHCNAQYVGDMLDHLVVGPASFRGGCAGDTFRRRGSNDVGGIASAVVKRQGVGGDGDGRG